MRLDEAAKAISEELGIDAKLVMAICLVESNLVTWSCRYEPGWKYFLNIEEWAQKLGQTINTERMQQATSWGPMQVMGSVARELGFKGHMPQLVVPEIGIRYGCLKLLSLMKRYSDEKDVIAAYNAGSARKDYNDRYVNYAYVDKVMANLTKLRGK